MITIRFSGRVPSPQEISIGMETDSNAEKIAFVLPKIADGQIATLQMILPDGVPDTLEIIQGEVTIPARIMEVQGTAQAWVEILADNVMAWHSGMITMGIGALPEISERTEQEYPTAFQDAIAQTLANKQAAEAAAQEAEIAAAIAESAQGQITVEINGDGDLIVSYVDTVGETHDVNLGPVSAYSVAVKYGYQGTEEEWEQNVASVGVNAAAAAESAEDAADSAEAAETAKTAAQAAQTAAETAAARDVTAWLDEHAQTAQIAVIDNTLTIEGAAAEAKVTGDELNSLKSAFDQVFKTTENIAETGSIKAKTNYDVTNNNDGTYTIGTTSYGTIVFGIEMTLKPGIYMLYGVPEGYSFLSSDGTASAQNSAIAINPTPNPKWVAITEDTTCYIGFRNDARPSASFIITPYLCIDSLAQTKNGINELNSNFDSLNKFCRKEIVTETYGSIPVTSGTEISSSKHLVNVSIASGETFKFKLNANGNLTSYHLYANGSALKYNCIAGTEYTLSKLSSITWLSIYVAGANVTGTGVVEGVVKQFSYTTDSLEERIENVEAEADNTKSTVGSIIDAETVFFSGEYEIGASVNNNGNATYIYHDVLFNIDGTKMIGILCDDIVNATAEFPIVVLERDSSNTTLKRHNISKAGAIGKNGIKIQPTGETTKIIVELYPSTTGGLTTQTAKYKNISIFLSNDGTYSIRNRNVPNPFPVPNYYLNAASNSYLQNKVSMIEGLIKDAEGNCDTFIFCTDQHWTLNAKQSPNLMNYICQRLVIPRMFMGGDYADGLNLNALKAYRDAFPGKIYDVIGNHEYMNYLAEIGESYVVHTIADGDIWAYINLHMTDAANGNFSRNYYYVDNPMQKMRYIVLNVYADNGNSAIAEFEEEQELWFTNTALDLPNGYTAVIFAHRILGVSYETGETVFRPEGARIAEIADAYTGSGEIACLIAGHTHVDGMTTTEGCIPVFVTTCDKYLPWVDGGVNQEPWLTENRHLGTITEQAFDVVVLDKKHKLISFVRIGAPADNGEEEKLQIRQQYYGE